MDMQLIMSPCRYSPDARLHDLYYGMAKVKSKCIQQRRGPEMLTRKLGMMVNVKGKLKRKNVTVLGLKLNLITVCIYCMNLRRIYWRKACFCNKGVFRTPTNILIAIFSLLVIRSRRNNIRTISQSTRLIEHHLKKSHINISI